MYVCMYDNTLNMSLAMCVPYIHVLVVTMMLEWKDNSMTKISSNQKVCMRYEKHNFLMYMFVLRVIQ